MDDTKAPAIHPAVAFGCKGLLPGGRVVRGRNAQSGTINVGKVVVEMAPERQTKP